MHIEKVVQFKQKSSKQYNTNNSFNFDILLEIKMKSKLKNFHLNPTFCLK